MGYSNDARMVRVDFFAKEGKWKYTDTLHWRTWSGLEIHDAFAQALIFTFGNKYKNLLAICLEPHHEHSHPIMLTEW